MIALVTGGGGFLGGAIVRRLLARGAKVRSFTRTAYPWLAELGVEQVKGDLSKLDDVRSAVSGCDIAYHVAAKAGVWGWYDDYYSTNVLGTKNVLQACREAGVPKLVYTSTPSVVHDGGDIEGGNESLPYPKRFSSVYPETKAIAEQAVLRANGPELSTVALRPHLIWGPGDPHLIPRLLARAQAGKLRRVGAKNVVVDTTFVDNAALAHVRAADALAPDSPVAGKAYFISNGEPMPMWDFLNRILADRGIEPVTRHVPLWLAKFAGSAYEAVYRLFRIAAEPPMTRFVAEQLGTSHWYDIAAARRDFGYSPEVSIEDGLRRLSSRTSESAPAAPARARMR